MNIYYASNAHYSKLLSIFFFTLMLGTTLNAQSQAAKNPSVFISDVSSALPIRIIAERADIHIIVYPDGHPDYEAVEAFIYTSSFPKDSPFIRAILTKHNGDQIEYRSNANTPILLRTSNDQKDYLIAFTLTDGLPLSMVYLGQTDPSASYGGMTDPGSHSKTSVLPLMFREASGLGSQHSYVRIGTQKYPVVLDSAISKPPFFYGYKAFLTLGFQSIFVPVFSSTIPLNPITEPIASIPLLEKFPKLSFNPVLVDVRTIALGESKQINFDFIPFSKIKNTNTPSSNSYAKGKITISRVSTYTAELRLKVKDLIWAEERSLLYKLEWTNTQMQISSYMENQ